MNPMTIKILFFGSVIFAVLLEIAGDIFFKEWSINGKNILFYMRIFLYIVGTVFF